MFAFFERLCCELPLGRYTKSTKNRKHFRQAITAIGAKIMLQKTNNVQ
jgi:hypothetical protein